jgi:integrase/recombinase XerC
MDITVALAPTAPPATPTRPTQPADLVASYLSGLAPSTVRAYEGDLRAFAKWLGATTTEAAAERLLSGSHGEANLLAHDWRASMIADGLAPASVNRRLTGLRGLVKLAHRIGLIGWDLSVQGVKSAAYRDTSGPGRQAIIDMLGYLARTNTPKSARDRAIVRLLYERGLRRGEAVSLDLDDVDLAARRIRVVGKGEREARWLSISTSTGNALYEWIAHRGDDPGPLFLNPGLGDHAGDAGAR